MLSPYLCRSLCRKPLRHFALFWTLMCAFLLPLIVSVYRDSLNYGKVLQMHNFTKDQAFHISGAAPEDAALFQGIDGLTDPYYEDRIVYLTFTSEEAWQQSRDDPEVLTAYSGVLHERMDRSQNVLRLSMFRYDEPEEDLAQRRLLLIVNLALLLFSGLIVQSAYRNHIVGFSQELADLAALGAGKRQIIGMFLLEFGILFPPAALCAVGLSWAVMRILYTRYLGNTAPSVTVWEVFRMDPVNTALEILFYLLVCLGAIVFSLLYTAPKKRKIQPQPSGSLPRLWRKRTNVPFSGCLVILVPLVAAFLILFNRYLGNYAVRVYNTQDAEIVVTSAGEGFSSEQLDAISGIPGIKQINPVLQSSESYLLQVPAGYYLPARLRCYQELAPGEPDLEKYQIAAQVIGSGSSGMTYFLCKRNMTDYVEVTLVKTLPLTEVQDDPNTAVCDVYISNALMEELEKKPTISDLYIYTAPEQAANVEVELRRNLFEYQFVSNFQHIADTSISQQEGRLWLLSWIFCILMIVSMQIVWVRLAKYVRDCAPMLRIVKQVGASKKQLSRLISVKWGAFSAAVLPFLLAIPWALLDARRNGRPFIVSVPLLGIYLLIAALAAATFWLPVKYTLHSVLKDTN